MSENHRNVLSVVFYHRKNPDFSGYRFQNEWIIDSIDGRKIEKNGYTTLEQIEGKRCRIYEKYTMHCWDTFDCWYAIGVFIRDKKGNLIFTVERFGNYPKLTKKKILTVKKVVEEIYTIKEYKP